MINQETSKPLISIITTVRNGENFIKDTLESVKNQTYRPIEHIIVDDGSQDMTVSIIESFKEQYLDYTLTLFQPKLLDRGKALNFAVLHSAGQWVAIIDADDLWHPVKLQHQYEFFKNQTIDILATKSDTFTSREKIMCDYSKTDERCIPISMRNLLKTNIITHSSVLIKKKLCYYNENRKSQYDYELWLRLACQGYAIASINQKFTFHRVHTSQFFEGKMGKKYRWKSFLLQTMYVFKNKNNIIMFLYIVMKFIIYDLLLPRKLRLMIRKRYVNY